MVGWQSWRALAVMLAGERSIAAWTLRAADHPRGNVAEGHRERGGLLSSRGSAVRRAQVGLNRTLQEKV